MKCLLFISLVLPLGGYSQQLLQSTNGGMDCFNSAIPRFRAELYRASVDVAGHHIGGLLFLKTLPDSSQRAVFSNEAGVTYFDFEWSKEGKFRTYHVIRKLKKKVVLKTLRKDFELIVIPASLKVSVTREMERQYSTARGREVLKFKITDKCEALKAIEVFGKKSKLVDGAYFPVGTNIPDSVSIVHHNFNMRIGLKRILR